MKPYGSGRLGERDDWSAYMPEDSRKQEPAAEAAASGYGEQPQPDARPQPRRPGRRSAQPAQQEPMDEEQAQVLATNRTVMLCCTLAAMISPFAAFLLYAERGSRAIRHNCLQSVALGLLHVIGGLCCLVPGMLLGGVPGLGVVVSLACWLVYLTLLVMVTVLRLRLMLHAWRGLRYDLPLLGWWLEKYV